MAPSAQLYLYSWSFTRATGKLVPQGQTLDSYMASNNDFGSTHWMGAVPATNEDTVSLSCCMEPWPHPSSAHPCLQTASFCGQSWQTRKQGTSLVRKEALLRGPFGWEHLPNWSCENEDKARVRCGGKQTMIGKTFSSILAPRRKLFPDEAFHQLPAGRPQGALATCLVQMVQHKQHLRLPIPSQLLTQKPEVLAGPPSTSSSCSPSRGDTERLSLAVSTLASVCRSLRYPVSW